MEDLKSSKKKIVNAKKIIIKLLQELEIKLAEAETSGITIEEVAPDLLFESIPKFAESLGETGMFSKYTARDALYELEDNGTIIKSEQGFYILKHDSKRINNIIKYQLYATPLPLKNQNDSIHYIEVSNNMAPFLVDLFNKSMQRNDKRFYSVAPNLLLLLDLEIPIELNIIEKQPFDLISFLNGYGITVHDYNTVCQEIKGTTYDELLEEERKMHELEIASNNHGKLNTPRRLKPRTPVTED